MANFKNIPIADATDEQLTAFAEATLQLDASGAKERGALLALILTAWPQDYILAELAETPEGFDSEQDEQVRVVAQLKLAGGIGDNDPKWVIRIGATELPGGKDPVPAGVNGRTVVIQRNTEVEVPHRYVLALQSARRETVQQNLETGEITRTAFSNYPIEVLERPSKAEIADWHARTDGVFAPA